MKHLKENWILYLILLMVAVFVIRDITVSGNKPEKKIAEEKEPDYWLAPSLYTDNLLEGEERKMVMYGQDLIAHTSRYFGPQGSVLQITNGMNCQNCHLNAGKQPWGNNYGAVASTYPKFRDRSGAVESIPKRVNDCFERSLNGKAIDSTGKEMKAIVAYIKWLGQDVTKGEKPKGSGITEVPYLDRPASVQNGVVVYTVKCQSCHGANGEGLKDASGVSYAYPPLWGEHSYNSGAGLFRLSRLAGYVKDNMPFNQSTHSNPSLTNEEAWDVAAFINSQPRPSRDLSKDWPDISKKPVDHPFGPYADGFSEQQHKYGPFKPIVEARKKQKEEKEKAKQAVTKN